MVRWLGCSSSFVGRGACSPTRGGGQLLGLSLGANQEFSSCWKVIFGCNVKASKQRSSEAFEFGYCHEDSLGGAPAAGSVIPPMGVTSTHTLDEHVYDDTNSHISSIGTKVPY